jgi:hypothetical protein
VLSFIIAEAIPVFDDLLAITGAVCSTPNA